MTICLFSRQVPATHEVNADVMLSDSLTCYCSYVQHFTGDANGAELSHASHAPQFLNQFKCLCAYARIDPATFSLKIIATHICRITGMWKIRHWITLALHIHSNVTFNNHVLWCLVACMVSVGCVCTGSLLQSGHFMKVLTWSMSSNVAEKCRGKKDLKC